MLNRRFLGFYWRGKTGNSIWLGMGKLWFGSKLLILLEKKEKSEIRIASVDKEDSIKHTYYGLYSKNASR